MGITSNEAQQRWNAAHYTQVKVSVPTELAAAFKVVCVAEGVSIASKIARFMREETSVCHPVKLSIDPYKTRP